MLGLTKTKELIENAERVYKAYMIIDLAMNPTYTNQKKGEFVINGVRQTFREFVEKMIQEKTFSQEFKAGNKSYKISIDNNQVNITPNGHELAESENNNLKETTEYNFNDFVNLTKEYPLTIEGSFEIKFSTKIKDNSTNQEIKIGGEGKIDLYSIHISNLLSIIRYIKEGKKENVHLLIAMATGSGKSFTQALWFLVLYLSKIKGIFTVPSNALAEQLKRDFGRLLPADLVNNVSLGIKNGDLNSSYIATNHKDLTLKNWKAFKNIYMDADQKDLYVSFDEVHEAMVEEVFQKRIISISEKYPLMLLSATPNRVSYEQISNGNPVVKLSLKKKRDLGISKPSYLIHHEAKNLAKWLDFVDPKMKSKPSKSIPFKLATKIDPLRTSPAHDYFRHSFIEFRLRDKEDPFYVDPKSVDAEKPLSINRFIRYNLSDAASEPPLILVKNIDTVINLSCILGTLPFLKNEGYGAEIYKKGNKVCRSMIYGGFNIFKREDTKDPEEKLAIAVREGVQKLRSDCFSNFMKNNNLDASKLEKIVDTSAEPIDMAKKRVLTGILENALLFLTGYDQHKLNMERYNNFEKVMDLVISKVEKFEDEIEKDKFKEYILNKLTKELGEDLGKEVSELIYFAVMNLYTNRKNRESLSMFVENWVLDKRITTDEVKNYEFGASCFDTLFNKFIIRFRSVFLFEGLKDKRTKIQDNKPFTILIESTEDLYPKIGKLNEKADHQLSTMENFFSSLYLYEPNYIDYSESQLDTLFRMKLIGNYITNKKVSGFNDLNLHNVAYLVEDEVEDLNNPNNIIQSFGRNRGLDPVKEPFYTIITDKGLNLTFDPKNMEQEDYFPALFKGQEEFHDKRLRYLGVEMANRLYDWVRKEIDPNGYIAPEKLDKECLTQVMEAFEKLYNENSFNFEKTRLEMQNIFKDMFIEINRIIKELSATKKDSILRKIGLLFLRAFSAMYFFFTTLKANMVFLKFSLSNTLSNIINKKDDLQSNEAVYVKILRNFSLKDMDYLKMLILAFGGSLANQGRASCEYALSKTALFTSSEEVVDKFNQVLGDTWDFFIKSWGIKDPDLINFVKKTNWFDSLSLFEDVVEELSLPSSQLSLFKRVAENIRDNGLKTKVNNFLTDIFSCVYMNGSLELDTSLVNLTDLLLSEERVERFKQLLSKTNDIKLFEELPSSKSCISLLEQLLSNESLNLNDDFLKEKDSFIGEITSVIKNVITEIAKTTQPENTELLASITNSSLEKDLFEKNPKLISDLSRLFNEDTITGSDEDMMIDLKKMCQFLCKSLENSSLNQCPGIDKLRSDIEKFSKLDQDEFNKHWVNFEEPSGRIQSSLVDNVLSFLKISDDLASSDEDKPLSNDSAPSDEDKPLSNDDSASSDEDKPLSFLGTPIEIPNISIDIEKLNYKKFCAPFNKFFMSKEASFIFTKILKSFTQKDLTTLLNSLYPNEIKKAKHGFPNHKKAEFITHFVSRAENLVGEKTFNIFLEDFLKDEKNLKSSKLLLLGEWIIEIVNEIQSCLDYFYNMESIRIEMDDNASKGASDGIKPSLYKENSSIFQVQLKKKDGNSVLASIATLSGIVDNALTIQHNTKSLEILANSNVFYLMENAAKTLVNDLKKVTEGEKIDNPMISKFAEELFKQKPFTKEEAVDPEMKYPNAVEMFKDKEKLHRVRKFK